MLHPAIRHPRPAAQDDAGLLSPVVMYCYGHTDFVASQCPASTAGRRTPPAKDLWSAVSSLPLYRGELLAGRAVQQSRTCITTNCVLQGADVFLPPTRSARQSCEKLAALQIALSILHPGPGQWAGRLGRPSGCPRITRHDADGATKHPRAGLGCPNANRRAEPADLSLPVLIGPHHGLGRLLVFHLSEHARGVFDVSVVGNRIASAAVHLHLVADRIGEPARAARAR